MADEGEEDEGEAEVANTSEPASMSWFAYAFMFMCVFMTAAMAYYAWGVFSRNV